MSQLPVADDKGMIDKKRLIRGDPDIRQVFKEDFKQYELTKSAIKIPLSKPVPVKLVTKIIKYAAKENLKKAKIK